jgi:hypothetical protein
MTSLAVDKIKTRVSLSLADRSQVTGYMFLSPIPNWVLDSKRFLKP